PHKLSARLRRENTRTAEPCRNEQDLLSSVPGRIVQGQGKIVRRAACTTEVGRHSNPRAHGNPPVRILPLPSGLFPTQRGKAAWIPLSPSLCNVIGRGLPALACDPRVRCLTLRQVSLRPPDVEKSSNKPRKAQWPWSHGQREIASSLHRAIGCRSSACRPNRAR